MNKFEMMNKMEELIKKDFVYSDTSFPCCFTAKVTGGEVHMNGFLTEKYIKEFANWLNGFCIDRGSSKE